MDRPHNEQSWGNPTVDSRVMKNQPTHSASLKVSEEEMAADVDEPPDLERTPRPSILRLHDSFKSSFSKRPPLHFDRKESLLTNALHSNSSSNCGSPVEESAESRNFRRGMSSASAWSTHSASTAELTSDGGLTSPGVRSRSPSPPPTLNFPTHIRISIAKPLNAPVSILRHGEDYMDPAPPSTENNVEVNLGRKRTIKFAATEHKEESKPQSTTSMAAKPEAPAPAIKKPTIKFACPAKVSVAAQPAANKPKPRMGRAMSPAPQLQKRRTRSKSAHRDSASTAPTRSPVLRRKAVPTEDRTRRLSQNSELGRTEAYRFHEFASSEEEVDEWLQESTCHRTRLTVQDTLRIENNLRKLAEEAEEEALDDDDEDEDDGDDVVNEDFDSDDIDEDESDEGFQTDDEEGFAGSDDESDAGSDFAWWAPGSTAATSVEQMEYIRPGRPRTISQSSLESVESQPGFRAGRSPAKQRRTRPVNIRAPSPELPDSTDFVCGTLDEDRPLEAAYLTCLERRRAAKHVPTPQDIDPTFPTSDPEMDEEDEEDDDVAESEAVPLDAEHHLMFHGQMEQLHHIGRGRSKAQGKRSPNLSPKRMRSPPPAKRTVHRSPPPRKLFGQSPTRRRSPPRPARLRSPPPTRRGSANVVPTQARMLATHFGGLGERPALTTSSSLPRTPVTSRAAYPDSEDEDTAAELPVRHAIAIKVGLEKRRQRRKEQLYRKTHRKGAKEKRPAPGKGFERMREMGLGLAGLTRKTGGAFGLAYDIPPTPEKGDMHVLSV
ncbi:hypothetical protein M011DRAFT_471187 [Sporormia fimetaria CBS 119925]|uniref:Extensin domain-containing protein n=1 Tax=Sporormia fimetaria CBS 119925 TaxID=1340428 RepID=A0A6A6V1M5_9PLEO|nr:hypothetical protein M011DRAFT_471187 [Sporormia fimetaria CBS 119925]